MATITATQRVRQGNLMDLPRLLPGEFGYATDVNKLFIGNLPITRTGDGNQTEFRMFVDLDDVVPESYFLYVDDVRQQIGADFQIDDDLIIFNSAPTGTVTLYYNSEVTLKTAPEGIVENLPKVTNLEAHDPLNGDFTLNTLPAITIDGSRFNDVEIRYTLRSQSGGIRKGTLSISLLEYTFDINDSYTTNVDEPDLGQVFGGQLTNGVFVLNYKTSTEHSAQMTWIEENFVTGGIYEPLLGGDNPAEVSPITEGPEVDISIEFKNLVGVTLDEGNLNSGQVLSFNGTNWSNTDPFSGSYNDLTDIPDLVVSYNDLTDTPEIPDVSNFLTETEIDTRIASTLSSGTIDLANYYTIPETEAYVAAYVTNTAGLATQQDVTDAEQDAIISSRMYTDAALITHIGDPTVDGTIGNTIADRIAASSGTAYDQSLNTTDSVQFASVTTDQLTISGTGFTEISSSTDISLIAPNRVSVTQSPFRLANMTTAQRDSVPVPADGDVIYNTELNRLQGYSNSQWSNIDNTNDNGTYKSVQVTGEVHVGFTASNNDSYAPIMIHAPLYGGFYSGTSTVDGTDFVEEIYNRKLSRYTSGGKIFISINDIGIADQTQRYFIGEYMFHRSGPNDTDFTVTPISEVGSTRLFSGLTVETATIGSDLHLVVKLRSPTAEITTTHMITGELTYTSQPISGTYSGY
jgi:hypothetical protein